jgi:hypothetical protein
LIARHHAGDDQAGSGRISDRTAAHAGKDQVGDDVDVCEPAAEAPDHGLGKAEEGSSTPLAFTGWRQR